LDEKDPILRKVEIDMQLDSNYQYRNVDQPLKAYTRDFIMKKMLGKGMYGRSYLVQNKNDSVIYSMKTFRKEVLDDQAGDNLDVEIHLLSQNMQDHETEEEKLVKEPLFGCL
jgi:serine/threonine protein kinase